MPTVGLSLFASAPGQQYQRQSIRAQTTDAEGNARNFSWIGSASPNLTLPSAAAELFADPLHVFVGVQPNQVANIGQSATLSRVQISGAATPLDDSFTGEALDAAKWQVVALDASGIIQVAASTKYWLSWPATATGFVVQSSDVLAAGAWKDAGLSNIVQLGTSKAVLVPSANLPSPATGYFRLIKP